MDHPLLCASCSYIKLLSLLYAFVMKGSWKLGIFNCVLKTNQQNSMFGTDVMVRCQTWNRNLPSPSPIAKSRFIADHIKSKYWSTAARKAEGPHGYGFLWKPIPTRLAVNENICFAWYKQSLWAEFVIRKRFNSLSPLNLQFLHVSHWRILSI